MAKFRYDGGNPTVASNYTADNSVVCPGNLLLCSINASANASGQPVITPALISEMLVAVVTNTPSSNVGLKNS